MDLKVLEFGYVRDQYNKRIITGTYILHDIDGLQTFSEVFAGEFAKKNLNEDKKGCFFLPYNREKDEEIRSLKFDDFYGEVKFAVPGTELTIEQLLVVSGNSENTIYIVQSGGIGGGGPVLSSIIDVIVESYCIFNTMMLEQPLLFLLLQGVVTFASSQRPQIKKTIRKVIDKYDNKRVYPLSFIDYIQSKNVWTMDELKLRFNEKDEKVLHALMNLSFYQYNERTEEYYPLSNEVLEMEVNDIILKDQLEIIAYYVLVLKNEENMEDLELGYLLSRLEGTYEKEIINTFIDNIDIIYKRIDEKE